jgi:hypothetical protein
MKIKKAMIYHRDVLVNTILYTTMSSEAIEGSYFFMLEKEAVAIVPYEYLLVLSVETPEELTKL